MATSTAGLLCVIFYILCVVVPSFATVYTVGDSAGWALGVDYDTWASGKTFVPGDSLVFNYGSSHNVDEVKANDYSSCTVGNSIKSDSSGATTVQLQAPGTRNFICGIPSHCSGGMKLTVTINAAVAAPSPPPSPSTGETTNAPSSTTTSPPPSESTTETDTTTTTGTPPSTSVTSPATTRNPAVTTRTVPSSSATVSPVVALIVSWGAIMWKFLL